MQTRRPYNSNGRNSGLSHLLVTACFLLFLPFCYRLLISDNKTSELKTVVLETLEAYNVHGMYS